MEFTLSHFVQQWNRASGARGSGGSGARGWRGLRVRGLGGGKGALTDPTTASVKIGNENIMFLANLPPPPTDSLDCYRSQRKVITIFVAPCEGPFRPFTPVYTES